MSQPSFVPVSKAGEVRPTFATPPAELGRPKKAGLLGGVPGEARGPGHGTPAPGEGYALTLASRLCDQLSFESEHDRADVECAIALITAKRASLINRGPILEDAKVARDYLGLDDVVSHEKALEYAGLAHSYVAQRRFTDAVTVADELLGH
ncbi:MAG TPA: hypothetical protein VMU98_00005 [Acidimicrobiales bacterium]|nr:hypothetical protein [Acidimicrobiales bacterium]